MDLKFQKKPKEKNYIGLFAILIVVIYAGYFFFYSTPEQVITDIDKQILEPTRLSDLNLNKLEESAFYRFQRLNEKTYPTELPDEYPYNEDITDLERKNPFLYSSGITKSPDFTKETVQEQPVLEENITQEEENPFVKLDEDEFYGDFQAFDFNSF